ncbi:MAG: ATPase, T2SS/T4P/T4SS family, partial [Desulfovibrio sp.]|uniref:ATPase, T2SS/T4P/T4SS family n=1 Tax=Desulfovibrio sp. TaxID=885 RepID=UPI0039E6816B
MLPRKAVSAPAAKHVEAAASHAAFAPAHRPVADTEKSASSSVRTKPGVCPVLANAPVMKGSVSTSGASAQRSADAQVKSVSKAQAQADSAGAKLRRMIHDEVFSQIDPIKAATTSRENLKTQISSLIKSICDANRLQLTGQEEESVAGQMLDEMLGVGPIEPLLADDTVNDILVNGCGQIFVERFGKLELSSVTFIDEEHVFNTAQRIAARVGRRIDEANPMVDARLQDGSRVNVITHPLALDGTT